MQRKLCQMLSGAAGVLSIAGLVVLLPRGVRADDGARPSVDLSRLQLGDDTATAPLDNGENAELTLDPNLQRAARRLLALARPLEGAITLVHARSGRLLVFAESSRKGGAAGSVLLASRQPAASVFKLVTTTALLEQRVVDAKTEVCTSGGTHRIERRHLEPPRSGRVICSPFGIALGHSRNAAYAQLATAHLSRDELGDTARRYGFNRELPFDARVPLGTLTLPYGDLDFARTAAGFTGSTLSPLGAAQLSYTVASGGRRMRLRLVRKSGDFEAPETREMLGRVTDEWTASRLTKMMEVTTREGTSAEVFSDETGRAYLPHMRVAGKTGTLQPSPKLPTTSWFTGFAPSKKPEVVVSVLLVNGGAWRRKANEVARDMLRAYFHAHGRRGVSDPFADPAPAARVARGPRAQR
ncbi:MAG: penicillin-binding protein [Polyangiaceae bacterium]|nr:penicillin-binding protein [Polyangiaceae bacterium]MCE7890184.1 penicillin-binding protein [Sorangiineae bacterium PRO1]MCL4754561.1 penicillin-binding protein [Myxococcales bacterium]